MPFEEFRKNGYRLQPLAPAPTPAAPAPCNTPAPVPRPVDDKVVDALQVRKGGEEEEKRGCSNITLTLSWMCCSVFCSGVLQCNMYCRVGAVAQESTIVL